jgi:glycosidase
MSTPYWVQDAIFYQIFPDRFANADPHNDPPNVQPWGTPPTSWGFQGGDLRGILQHMDYLLGLGINAIYLNPIFMATTNHRYNTSDYYKIDPKLGTQQDFRDLIDAAHRNSIRVILDGVFNHCGRGFFAFMDILENGANSPYKDWFHVRQFPLDAYGPGDPQAYVGWWNHKSLPKFNTDTPEVRKYLLDVARYWIMQGTDGWRLDVPNEINDDAFWEEFRHVVKSANRDAYLVGEIWDVNPRWANDTHFDGLMNYPVRDALIPLLQGRENLSQFNDRLDKFFKAYKRENIYAMYCPLSSHDTERIKTLMGNDLAKTKLAYQFLLGFPGAPAIYYGDEIGLEGERDPDCRRAFPWKEAGWNRELLQWIKRLIALRKRMPILRHGEFLRLVAENDLYAYGRTLGEESFVMAMNPTSQTRQISIPSVRLKWEDQRVVQNLLDAQRYTVTGSKLKLELPAYSGVWLGQP